MPHHYILSPKVCQRFHMWQTGLCRVQFDPVNEHNVKVNVVKTWMGSCRRTRMRSAGKVNSTHVMPVLWKLNIYWLLQPQQSFPVRPGSGCHGDYVMLQQREGRRMRSVKGRARAQSQPQRVSPPLRHSATQPLWAGTSSRPDQDHHTQHIYSSWHTPRRQHAWNRAPAGWPVREPDWSQGLLNHTILLSR